MRWTFPIVPLAAACVIHAGCGAPSDDQGAQQDEPTDVRARDSLAPQSEGDRFPGVTDQLEQLASEYEANLHAISERYEPAATDALGRMSGDELREVVSSSIWPWHLEVAEQDKAYSEAAGEAIRPLEQALAIQETAASQEDNSGTELAMPRPRPFEQGWQGEDSISGEWVYVETTRHAPEPIGNTLRLAPIMGRFQRAHEVRGTNRYGATVSIPRFVDTPYDERQALFALHREWERHSANLDARRAEIRQRVCKQAITAYRAIADRFMVLTQDSSLTAAFDLWSALRFGEVPFDLEHRAVNFYDAAFAVDWSGAGTYVNWHGEPLDCSARATIARLRSDDSNQSARLPQYQIDLKIEYTNRYHETYSRAWRFAGRCEIQANRIVFGWDGKSVESTDFVPTDIEAWLDEWGRQCVIRLENAEGHSGLRVALRNTTHLP